MIEYFRTGPIGAALAAFLMAVPVAQAASGARHGSTIRVGRSHSAHFRDISAAVAKITPGRILRIRDTRRLGRAVYIVRVLRPDGRRRDIVLDAATLMPIEK